MSGLAALVSQSLPIEWVNHSIHVKCITLNSYTSLMQSGNLDYGQAAAQMFTQTMQDQSISAA